MLISAHSYAQNIATYTNNILHSINNIKSTMFHVHTQKTERRVNNTEYTCTIMLVLNIYLTLREHNSTTNSAKYTQIASCTLTSFMYSFMLIHRKLRDFIVTQKIHRNNDVQYHTFSITSPRAYSSAKNIATENTPQPTNWPTDYLTWWKK